MPNILIEVTKEELAQLRARKQGHTWRDLLMLATRLEGTEYITRSEYDYGQNKLKEYLEGKLALVMDKVQSQ